MQAWTKFALARLGWAPRLRPALREYRWFGLTVSSSAHVLLLAILAIGLPDWREPEDPRDTNRLVTTTLAPAEGHKPKREDRLSFGARPSIVVNTVGVEPRVNMNRIQISFADDVANQLPGVVSRFRGALALMDRQDDKFTNYLIQPPEWRVQKVQVDVSGKYCLHLEPPRRWAVLDGVARREFPALDRYPVFALFQRDYAGCLAEAIRSYASQDAHGRNVQVRSARLAFEGDRPCGVKVLGVGYDSATNE